MHFLDPFNNGIREYEITDIMFSKLRSNKVTLDDRIILINSGKPSREELADLITRIEAYSPKVIGVDIFLEGRKDPKQDSLLRATLQQYNNIVLASELGPYLADQNVFLPEMTIDTLFTRVSATGFGNFPANLNRTIRLFSPWEKTTTGESTAFATQLVKAYAPEKLIPLRERKKPWEYVHYVGNTDNFFLYEKEYLLDDNIDLKPIIEGEIVLLGYIGNYSLEEPMLDRYFTPLNDKYAGRTTPDMYGLVIHANIIRMILDEQYINIIPGWLIFLLAFIFTYINVLIIHRIYYRFNQAFHGITRVLQLVEFIGIFFLISFLFTTFRVKLDFGLGILALLLAYDIVMIYESLIRPKLAKWPLINRWIKPKVSPNINS